MSQTTTSRGRLGVADPDLGFDTLDTGTALHSAVSTMFTQFSDHLLGRYFTYTLADTVSQTVTHNFGLAIAKLKIIMFESGVQLTEAQIAAHYTITQSSTNAISVQNTSGGPLTFLIYVVSFRLNATSSDFDAACSIDTTGNIRAAELRTTGNDIVINHDAAGSGADWTLTLRRQSSGMSGAAVISFPTATATLATLGLAETLALKTLTGVAGITLAASASIDWAAGNAAIGASIGANTLTIGGASSTVRVTGTLSCATFVTDSNDLVLNTDAAGSGADWTGTIRRPSSGMSGAAIWTMPIITATIMGRETTDTMTNKTATAMAVTAGSYINLLAQAAIRFNDDSGGEYVALKATTGVTTYTITLPAAVPSANQVLADAGAGNGVLAWVTIASSSLNQYNVDVGNSSNARTALNTNLLGDVTGSAISQSYTVTSAAPGVFTVAAAPATGDSAYVTVTQNGFTANTRYYVTNIDATTFKLATTLSNAIAGTNITSSGTTPGTIVTGGLTLNSTIPIRGSIVNADGSVSAPSYSFSSDTNTGMFRIGTDNLGLVTGGITRMQFTSAGYTWLGGGSNQNYTLDVTNGIADWLVHISNTTANGGLLLLDITDSSEMLRIRGSASPAIQFYGDGTANKVGGGSWSATSDERAKKNISEFKDGLDVALALKPITFQYNGLYETTDDGKTYRGMIAQEVEKITPYMVKDIMTPKGTAKGEAHRKSDDEKVPVKNMDPSALNYILLNAVKEISAKYNELEKKVKTLEEK